MNENNKKKSYRVAIVETLRMVVTVEAADEIDAHQMVSDRWHNGDYILDADAFDGAEFHVLGEMVDSEVDKGKTDVEAEAGKDGADR